MSLLSPNAFINQQTKGTDLELIDVRLHEIRLPGRGVKEPVQGDGTLVQPITQLLPCVVELHSTQTSNTWTLTAQFQRDLPLLQSYTLYTALFTFITLAILCPNRMENYFTFAPKFDLS